MQKTFALISQQNRKMEPSHVWLMFIPIFNIGWRFVIVNRMADSLKAELASRNIVVSEENPGKSIGIAYCILMCCGIIPFIGPLASLVGLALWIAYWVKISQYKAMLVNLK